MKTFLHIHVVLCCALFLFGCTHLGARNIETDALKIYPRLPPLSEVVAPERVPPNPHGPRILPASIAPVHTGTAIASWSTEHQGLPKTKKWRTQSLGMGRQYKHSSMGYGLAPGHGALHVQVQGNKDCTVRVDGRGLRRLSERKRSVRSGTHRVTVRCLGSGVYRNFVRVDAGESKRIKLTQADFSRPKQRRSRMW